MKGKTFAGAMMLFFGYIFLVGNEDRMIETKLFCVGMCTIGILLIYWGIKLSRKERKERKAREKEEQERRQREEALRDVYRAGRIELVEAGGKAWNKAKDIRIASVS